MYALHSKYTKKSVKYKLVEKGLKYMYALHSRHKNVAKGLRHMCVLYVKETFTKGLKYMSVWHSQKTGCKRVKI